MARNRDRWLISREFFVSQNIKSMLWFGLAIDAIIIGGTVLARVFFNNAPTAFHQFVQMSLWATIAAGILCVILTLQISKMAKKSKVARLKASNTSHTKPPNRASIKNQKTDSSVLLVFLIMAPGAFIIIPLVQGSVAFAHDYARLIKEFAVFVALYFCCRAFALARKSLKKANAKI